MENNKKMIFLDIELLRNPQIKIFSKKEDDGQLNYIVSLDSKEDAQANSDRIAIMKFTQGNPKEIKESVSKLLSLISDEKVDSREVKYVMNQLKKSGDVEFTNEYNEISQAIKESKETENSEILVEREIRLEEIFQTRDEVAEYEAINYSELDEMLPIIKKIDVDSLSEDVVRKVGETTQKRLECLDKIQSESDVEQYKDSLESFMQYRENSNTNRARIIANYIKKVKKMDSYTVIDCLRAMEDESNGEDAKLYSIYLRIQEKRIIKKVQDYIINLKSEQGLADGEIERFGEFLEEQKIEDINPNNFNSVVLEAINNENNKMEQYLKVGRKTDFELMRYIRTSPGNGEDEILKYLQCRVTSLGQVVKNDKKEYELRNYIETTQFKDDNVKEQNYFLLQVSKIEKNYLLSKYGGILDKYQSLETGENKKSLLDYEEQLKGLENKKIEAKNLYQQYSMTYNKENREKDKKDDER